MKKQFFALALMAIAITSTLFAQESSSPGAKKSDGNNGNSPSCAGVVKSTTNGIALTFYSVKAPRDAASGQASGKRQHKPFNFVISSADNSVTEVKIKTGAATSADKASYSDMTIHITRDGRLVKVPVDDGEFLLPINLSDGMYDMVFSWSWGASNSGSQKTGTVKFFVEIKDGSCFGINEQGVK